jgi:hypothetical protein
MQLASFDRAVDCAQENNGLERADASSRVNPAKAHRGMCENLLSTSESRPFS